MEEEKEDPNICDGSCEGQAYWEPCFHCGQEQCCDGYHHDEDCPHHVED